MIKNFVLCRGSSLALLALPLAVFLSAARAADEYDSVRVHGSVTDAEGKPLMGAHVWINNTQEAEHAPGNKLETTTDKDGNYELTVRFVKGQTLLVTQMYAEKPGYVRDGPPLKTSLNDGEKARVDFHLEQGEILAGEFRLPLLPHEHKMPAAAIVRVFEVTGPNIDQLAINGRSHLIDAKGKFEIYVPRGRYTLRIYHYDEPLEWNEIEAPQKNLVLNVPPFEWSELNLGKVFDQLWNLMDNGYSYFFLKKDVDWQALREKYRPQAILAKTPAELTAVLVEMLAPLNDMHVWIETPSGVVPTRTGGYRYNGNRQVVLAQLEDPVQCGNFAVVGKTKGDGFGYFLMLNQSEANEADVKTAVEAIGKLRAAPAFIVDLRTANGGNELLAQEIARQFCATRPVYAKSKYRAGPGHEEFGQVHDRVLPSSDDAFTRPVVCLIGPGAVSSGEGFVQMMKCLPHVTTVGLPTRGASGKPGPWKLSRTGLSVYFSTWVDMMPDGTPIEGVGIAPDVRVEMPKQAYQSADPTLEKALEILRAKVADAKR